MATMSKRSIQARAASAQSGLLLAAVLLGSACSGADAQGGREQGALRTDTDAVTEGALDESAESVTSTEEPAAALDESPSVASTEESEVRVEAAEGTSGEHDGDLRIATPAEAAEWAHVRTLRGDLTVEGEGLEAIALPNLERVEGNVHVSYPRGAEDFPPTRAFLAPKLREIQGELLLTSDGPREQPIVLDTGLNALTSLTGHLRIDVLAFNVDFAGLNALTAVGGDVEILSGTGDTSGGGFLMALERIAGNLYCDLGNGVFAFLPALVRVEGGFELVKGNPSANAFAKLSSVAGDMLLEEVAFSVLPNAFVLQALTSVRGRLALRGSAVAMLHVGATAGLEVGALDVQENENLGALDAHHIRVQGAGTVSVLNNKRLCTTLARSFVSGLSGFSGTSVVTGNADC